MKKRLILCAVSAAAGVLLMALNSLIFGVGFLVFLLGALLVFAGWWALLKAPWREKRARSAAKILRIITLCMAALAVLSFIAVEALIIRGMRGDRDTDAPAIIVLGAGLRGETPSLMLKYRLDAAKTWLDEHPDAVAVLSGGQGPLEEITEAEAMRRYLVNRGVDESRLLLETESGNTLQNIEFSKHVLARHEITDGPIAVVSTDFHLYRAGRICKGAGLDGRMVPARLPMVGLVPLNSWLREYASVMLLYAKELIA